MGSEFIPSGTCIALVKKSFLEYAPITGFTCYSLDCNCDWAFIAFGTWYCVGMGYRWQLTPYCPSDVRLPVPTRILLGFQKQEKKN